MNATRTRSFSATRGKQQFADLLDAAAREPVPVERHGRVRAFVVSPEHFARFARGDDPLSERRAARAAQELMEKDRMIKHQHIAIQLLSLPAKARRTLIGRAKAVVSRWSAEGLCSRDYIDRWEALLSLPARELATAIVSDLDGWGRALRQNSPWVGDVSR